MATSKILVSGKNGQLGKELQQLSTQFPGIEFIFLDKQGLDIAEESSVKRAFEKYSPSHFINCAAYTAVDKAETEQEAAYKTNAEAVGNIARYAYEFNTSLVHVSTDYVFEGNAKNPYKETDPTNPINYYGYTKWLGEQLALQNNPNTIIIRSSWIYSSFGHNFVKTMLRLMKERKEISVVNDQFGSPTYAKDLAEAILSIVNGELSVVNGEDQTSNIFHFSNDGIISWYDFAVAIKNIEGLDCIIHPIATTSYPTPAKRPAFSGLDKTKISRAFGIRLKNWQDSLKECLELLSSK
ncbi:MAG TPA: dTDP-4-dehydrorhamnose reductase [Parafilimonas sp.]|nr:dTDP-4-dehydrorhamnose reductase [Parafilimonas sp.]